MQPTKSLDAGSSASSSPATYSSKVSAAEEERRRGQIENTSGDDEDELARAEPAAVAAATSPEPLCGTKSDSTDLLSTVSEASGESTSASGVKERVGVAAASAADEDNEAKREQQQLLLGAENLATEQDLAHSDYTLRSLASETTELSMPISDAAAAGGSQATSAAAAHSRRMLDCPYVHDSPTAGQVFCGGQQQSSVSPPTTAPPATPSAGLSQVKRRLSHDDTMEAIEEDVVEEMEEAADGAHLDEQLSIAPPAGFSSAAASAGGESVSSGRVSAPIEEEDEPSDEGDEDDESSISVSQTHGVVVTRDVIGTNGAGSSAKRDKQATSEHEKGEKENNKSSPSSSDATPTRSHTSRTGSSASSATSSPTSSSSSSSTNAAPSAAESPAKLPLLEADDDEGDGDGQRTPTKQEPTLSAEEAKQEVVQRQEQQPKSEQQPLEYRVEKLSSPQTTTCSSESGTHAILDHLSRHECVALGGALDEPAPSLEQSRPIELAARRASWRRESTSSRLRAQTEPQEATSATNPDAEEDVGQTQVSSPTAELSAGTDTIKRRRKLPSAASSKDAAAAADDAQPPVGITSGPAPTSPVVSSDVLQSNKQPSAARTAASAGSVDTSICSSCSCLEPPGELRSAPEGVPAVSTRDQRQQWMSQEEGTVFTENYWLSHWLYISELEEAELWRRAIDMAGPSQQSSSLPPTTTTTTTTTTTQPQDEPLDGIPKDMTETASTTSESSFSSRYKSTTRKMIHRRASIEMYKRILANKLRCEKRVEISRSNGEFGFRIHGSRPVVVSAIERGTAAETCGLQVGDLIYAINGTNILDMAHSDVVRLAHTGKF